MSRAVSRKDIPEEWPEDIKDTFARYPGATAAVKKTDFGTTVFKTKNYKSPADGVDHFRPDDGEDHRRER